jgi:hypothetical protein
MAGARQRPPPCVRRGKSQIHSEPPPIDLQTKWDHVGKLFYLPVTYLFFMAVSWEYDSVGYRRGAMAKRKPKTTAKRIPKKVAGVKVPKSVRKQADKAIEYAGSGAVRDVVGAALVAAATALAANQDVRRAVKEKVKEVGKGLQGAGRDASSAASDFASDSAAAAESFKTFAIGAARRLLDAWENPVEGGDSPVAGTGRKSSPKAKSGTKASKKS